MKQKNLLLLIWTLMWNLWNIQIRIVEFLSQKWTSGPYGFAILHVLGIGFGFFLPDRAYGTGPGCNQSLFRILIYTSLYKACKTKNNSIKKTRPGRVVKCVSAIENVCIYVIFSFLFTITKISHHLSIEINLSQSNYSKIGKRTCYRYVYTQFLAAKIWSFINHSTSKWVTESEAISLFALY